MSISYTETAILGLLYEHHHYAERLVEIMEKREMRNWTEIDFSSIQNILNRLEDKNLIKYEIRDPNSKNSCKVYEITDKGRVILKEKIKNILSTREKIISPLDLGIANMNVLSDGQIVQSLDHYTSHWIIKSITLINPLNYKRRIIYPTIL